MYTLYIPLRYRILYLTHFNTQRKVYHSIPLHTYTVNFATSSNLQEILSNSTFLHLFLLIMCEKNYAYTLHTPLKHYLLYLKHVNTQREFYQSCRWGVAPPPPRRTSVRKQVGRRRRGALVVGIANALYWKRTLSSPHSFFLSLHPSFSSFLSLPLTFTLTI